MDTDSRTGASSSQAVDPTVALSNTILKLSTLIEEQNALLRRQVQRKEWADKSRQPIPEVPATSSSAWNALLRSTMSDVIQPTADGWRSGLDALLVFLGLFSAIITAFIVPSLADLKPDEIARTNELLSNITSIMIIANGGNATEFNLKEPELFVPAASDVRFNVYLTLSLIISLSIGALAIACRGFLNLVSWSHHNKAVDRLTDIRTRWKSAEHLLGPTIESLPQLLIVPVLLFILGLVDYLFSTTLQVASPPLAMLVTSSLSVLFVAVVALGMSFTLLDGSLRPTTSPFQSRLSHLVNVSVVQRIQSGLVRVRSLTACRIEASIAKSPPVNPSPSLSAESMRIYHEIVQATRDDDILDEASAALFNIIAQRTTYHSPSNRWRFFRRLPVDLLPQECATLLHLLSPEASVRSHRTAAQVIVNIASNANARSLRYSQNDIGRLLPSISQAARRADPAASLSALWNSQFLCAMGIVANSGVAATAYPPAVVFLGARHWSWKYLAPIELCEIFAFVFEVIDEKIDQELSEVDDADAASVVDSVLSNPDLTSSTTQAPIDPRNVVASLLYLPGDHQHLLKHIIPWLIRMHSPAKVIACAHEHIETIQRSEWLHLLGHREYSMVPRLVEGIATVCFAIEGFIEHEMLVRLCTACLLRTPNILSRPPSGFVFFARPVLNALLTAVNSDPTCMESADVLQDLSDIRCSVADDLLWKDGKAEILQGFDELPSENSPSEGPVTAQSSNPPEYSPIKVRHRSISPGAQRYEAAEAGKSVERMASGKADPDFN